MCISLSDRVRFHVLKNPLQKIRFTTAKTREFLKTLRAALLVLVFVTFIGVFITELKGGLGLAPTESSNDLFAYT